MKQFRIRVKAMANDNVVRTYDLLEWGKTLKSVKEFVNQKFEDVGFSVIKISTVKENDWFDPI